MAVENIRPIHRPAAEITPIRPGIPVPPAQPLPIGFPDNISYLTPPVVLAPLAPSPELAHLPLPRPEWLPEKLNHAGSTALHESQHVLLGWRFGVPVEAVSVIPNPSAGYLGITIFSGNLLHRPDVLQIIAGGGAVNPVGGHNAEGFGHHALPGSDMGVADSMSPLTGKTAEDTVAESEGLLNEFDDEARQFVADAIETMRLIQGSAKIDELIDYAIDFAKRQGKTEYEVTPVIEEPAEDIHAREMFEKSVAHGDRTILITPYEGPQLVIVKEKDDPFALDEEEEETENEKKEDGEKEEEKILQVDDHPTVVFNEKNHKRKRFLLN